MKKWILLILICNFALGAGYKEDLTMNIGSSGIPTAIKFKSGLPGSKTIKMYNSGGQLCIGNTISPTVIDGVGDGGLLLLPESTWKYSSGHELDVRYELGGRYNAVNAGQLKAVIDDLKGNYITTDENDGKDANIKLYFDNSNNKNDNYIQYDGKNLNIFGSKIALTNGNASLIIDDKVSIIPEAGIVLYHNIGEGGNICKNITGWIAIQQGKLNSDNARFGIRVSNNSNVKIKMSDKDESNKDYTLDCGKAKIKNVDSIELINGLKITSTGQIIGVAPADLP